MDWQGKRTCRRRSEWHSRPWQRRYANERRHASSRSYRTCEHCHRAAWLLDTPMTLAPIRACRQSFCPIQFLPSSIPELVAFDGIEAVTAEPALVSEELEVLAGRAAGYLERGAHNRACAIGGPRLEMDRVCTGGHAYVDDIDIVCCHAFGKRAAVVDRKSESGGCEAVTSNVVSPHPYG